MVEYERNKYAKGKFSSMFSKINNVHRLNNNRSTFGGTG